MQIIRREKRLPKPSSRVDEILNFINSVFEELGPVEAGVEAEAAWLEQRLLPRVVSSGRTCSPYRTLDSWF